MKNTPNRTKHSGNLIISCSSGMFCRVAGFVLMMGISFRAMAYSVISPDGSSYTGVAASSEFNGSYTAANLFNYDVSGTAVGSLLSDSSEWAVSGPPVTNGYVAFDLVATHAASSLFFAQRYSGFPPGDMMDIAQIWASSVSPFDPNSPPISAPNAVVVITNKSPQVWTEYPLSSVVVGRYFLINYIQTNGAGYAPGGTEMRLGEVPISAPPTITKQPTSKTIYLGGSAKFSVNVSGSTPLGFRWKQGSTVLTDGPRVSGATTSTLNITGLVGGDAGDYSCIVTNAVGNQVSSNATLTLIPAPTSACPAVVFSKVPLAYWRFNENAGATVAPDYACGYDGTYGASASVGVAGPRPPTFPGFESGNLAVQTLLGTPDSAMAIPPLNLNTNTVTITAWIYPNSVQSAYATLFFSRAAGTVAGLNYYGDGATLGYQWNGAHWDFDSGLTIPVGQWSMVAMVITPTNATLYLGTSNQLSSSVDATVEFPEAFAGGGSIGRDNAADSSRVFDGMIDDVAVFNRALTSTDMETLYATATGGTLPPILLDWAVSPSGLTLTWPSPWTLMQADAVTGPWAVATGVTSGVPIPMSAQARFYRLQY